MTRLLPIILAILTLPLCRAADSPYARAEEFGYPRLQLQAAEHISPAPMRTWHPAGEPPLQAVPVSMSGTWGKEAVITLRTPTGRTMEVSAQALSDADLDAVRGWLAQNEMMPIRTRAHGDYTARILEVSYTAGVKMTGSGPQPCSDKELLMLRFATPDGTVYSRICHAKPLNDSELQQARRAGKISSDVWVLHEETHRALLRHLQEPSPATPTTTPLPIADNLPEALACAALRDVSIVYLTLGPRGCAADTALRTYLSRHPEAAATWAQRHVFLIAYRDAQGKLPEQCYKDLEQLYRHHNILTTRDFTQETPYSVQRCSQMVSGRLFVQPHNFTTLQSGSTYAFEFSPTVLQSLSPAEVSFGPGLRQFQ